MLKTAVRHAIFEGDEKQENTAMQATLPHPKYIVDEKGKKKSVVLSIKDYEALLQEIEDLADIAERRDEPTKPHQEFIVELKADGYL